MPTTGSLDLQNQLDAALIEASQFKAEVVALKAQILILQSRVQELEALLPPSPDATTATNFIRSRRR